MGAAFFNQDNERPAGGSDESLTFYQSQVLRSTHFPLCRLRLRFFHLKHIAVLPDGGAALEHGVHEVHPRVVGEVRRRRGVQQQKIRVFAGLKSTGARREFERRGPVQGEGGERLFDRHVHIQHRQGENERNGLTVAGARIQVACQGNGAAGIDEAAAAGAGLAEVEGGEGEKAGDSARGGERGYVVVGGFEKMVRADGAEFGGEGGTAERGDFVGMEFEREAGCACTLEIPA